MSTSAPDPRADDAQVAWPRAIARLSRAVTRFHERSVELTDRSIRLQVAEHAEVLDSCLSDIQTARRAVAEPAQQAAVLRATQRAATLTAHATEAMMQAEETTQRRDFEAVVTHMTQLSSLTARIRELADSCLINT